MAVYDFFVSRNNAFVTAETYVGHQGRLFYDDVTGNLRISDGVTPGGNPVPLQLATASNPGAVQPGAGLQVDGLGILTVKDGDGITFDGSNNLTIAMATSDTLGGIKLGPGVTLNAQDQLIIDSAGLDFSFGDFSATSEPGVDSTTSAVLSSINADEPIVIRANGYASVSVEGEFNVFPPDGSLGDREPVLNIQDDGRVRVIVTDSTDVEAGVNIIGNAEGNELVLANPGCMLHITGMENKSSRITMDGVGAFSQFGGRRINGTVASPTQVLEDEVVTRFSANPNTDDEGFEPPASAYLAFVANQDISSDAQGMRGEFWITPNDSDTPEKILTIDGDGVTMVAEKTVNNLTALVFDTTHLDDHTDEGTLCWSAEDATLNLHHAGGVVQQIGQEQYVYANNDTGSTIADGTVVRFSGAAETDGYKLQVAPFEADGTYPNIYTVGVTTQSIADGADGLVTTFGKVRGLNTTGGAENWQLGDVLYASPTTAGALTNVKPTSPNNVVPIAAVLRVHATLGELFVRPTLDQGYDYGKFTRNTDVSAASTNTAYTITLDTTEQSSGISLGTPASRISVSQSGLYNVAVQAQAYSGSETGDETYYVWLRKNGTDVPRSMKRTSTTQDLLYTTLSFSFTLSLEANDYVEVAYAFTDTGLSYEAVGATGFGPSTPSISVDITQVQN